MPVTVERHGGVTTYVPTRAGILVFGSNGRAKEIHSIDHEVAALNVNDGNPFFVGRAGAVALSGGAAPICPALVKRISKLPADQHVLALDPRGHKEWDVLLGTPEYGRPLERLIQARFMCEGGGRKLGSLMPWVQRARTSDRLRLEGNSGRWPTAGPELIVWLHENVLELADGGGNTTSLSVAIGSRPRSIAMTRDRLFLLTENELFVSEIDALLSYLHESTQGDRKSLRSGFVEAIEPRAELDTEQRKAVQSALRERKLYLGASDGIFGPLTKSAIEAFQEAEGYQVTGALTSSQFEILIRSSQNKMGSE